VAHLEPLDRVMKYCLRTNMTGLVIKPEGIWGGKRQGISFETEGYSDFDYAKDLEE
jgi:hypothetical protein